MGRTPKQSIDKIWGNSSIDYLRPQGIGIKESREQATVEPQLSGPHLSGFSDNRITEMTALLE